MNITDIKLYIIKNGKYRTISTQKAKITPRKQVNIEPNMNLEIGSDRIKNNFGNDWHTLDIKDSADIVHDLEEFPYPIYSNAYEVVYMSHVLEHIRWTETHKVLTELYRILKPGGAVEIFVPDFDKIIKGYTDNEIPEAWSHANPERNLYKWINGRIFAYGEPENLHKACFNYEYLEQCLQTAGFKDIERLKKPRGYDHGYINLGIKGIK